jgi:hypothetical protein
MVRGVELMAPGPCGEAVNDRARYRVTLELWPPTGTSAWIRKRPWYSSILVT